MITLEALNGKIDHWLLAHHINLKRPKPPPFESELSQIIQSFIINYGCGMTLEQALAITLTNGSKDPTLLKHIHVSPHAIEGINRYALEVENKEIWRFVRLINQLHLTGSTITRLALEKYHDELWENKLSNVRKKSEKVSVQLTFLLMLSLISVIIVVITPIMLLL